MLDHAVLEAALRRFADPEDPSFTGFPADLAAAGEAWKGALVEYLAGAVDVSGDPIVPVPGVAPTLVGPVGSAAAFAAALETALVASLAGALFSVGVPPSPASACPSVGGTGLWSLEVLSQVVAVLPVIAAGVLPVLAPSGSSGQLGVVAGAIHSAILGAVVVLVTGLDTTPPPAGPLPITNTCGVT